MGSSHPLRTHRIGESHRESNFSSAVSAAAERLADSPPGLAHGARLVRAVVERFVPVFDALSALLKVVHEPVRHDAGLELVGHLPEIGRNQRALVAGRQHRLDPW